MVYCINHYFLFDWTKFRILYLWQEVDYALVRRYVLNEKWWMLSIVHGILQSLSWNYTSCAHDSAVQEKHYNIFDLQVKW